jgi:hypothetical protein
MRIATIRQGDQTGVVDVDFGKILTLVTSTGAVAGVISVLTFFLVDAPKGRLDRETSATNLQVSLLRNALSLEQGLDRAQTVRILIAADLLKDPDGNLQRLSAFPDSLPQWPQQSSMPVPPTPPPNPPPAPNPIPPRP